MESAWVMTVSTRWKTNGREPPVWRRSVHASCSRDGHVRRAEILDRRSVGRLGTLSYPHRLARIAPQWWQTRVSEPTPPAQ